MLNDTKEPLPGLLRVEASIKGTPPRLIPIPLPDPCFLYFQRVGERLFVARLFGNQPYPLGQPSIASLKRQNLGSWKDVR
ncbi:hypothetical protein ASE13_02200 [Sphingomonas sp. Root241]|nr:hypothetical protein ASE13_02200 [Sphingomonas sp. Root241]